MKNGMLVEGGTNFWYLNDELHREDGPAIEWTGGDKFWYHNGKLHRVDGPAQEWANGNKFWYLNGELHREDGPAQEWATGTKWWYLHGKRHRIDGPAEEWVNGFECWFLNDEELVQPKEFPTIEEWFLKLNTNEEYSYQYINDIEGLIEIIKNPTPKQKRLHQMRWVL